MLCFIQPDSVIALLLFLLWNMCPSGFENLTVILYAKAVHLHTTEELQCTMSRIIKNIFFTCIIINVCPAVLRSMNSNYTTNNCTCKVHRHYLNLILQCYISKLKLFVKFFWEDLCHILKVVGKDLKICFGGLEEYLYGLC